MTTNNHGSTNYSCKKRCRLLTNVYSINTNVLFSVNSLLHSTMALEKLGGRQDSCVDDGLGHWCGPGNLLNLIYCAVMRPPMYIINSGGWEYNNLTKIFVRMWKNVKRKDFCWTTSQTT